MGRAGHVERGPVNMQIDKCGRLRRNVTWGCQQQFYFCVCAALGLAGRRRRRTLRLIFSGARRWRVSPVTPAECYAHPVLSPPCSPEPYPYKLKNQPHCWAVSHHRCPQARVPITGIYYVDDSAGATTHQCLVQGRPHRWVRRWTRDL